jgi:hypothetical protein
MNEKELVEFAERFLAEMVSKSYTLEEAKAKTIIDKTHKSAVQERRSAFRVVENKD